MGFLLGVQVEYHPPGTTADTGVTVSSEHWDELKNSLDQNEKGWRELTTPHGGKWMMRVEWIVSLFLVTPEYKEAREAWDDEDRQANIARGGSE